MSPAASRPGPRSVAAFASAAAALACLGCNAPSGEPPSGDDDPVLSPVVGLRIEPEAPTVSVGPGAPQEVDFTAVILREDGSEEPTNVVTWTASNASLGTLSDRGVFTTFDDRGGTSNVTAQYFGQEATTRLTVIYTDAIDGVELPTGAHELFTDAPGAAPVDGPHMIYPEDGVVIPKNQPEILFMWNPGSGVDQANLFRLTFGSPILSVSIYTEGTSYSPSPELWGIVSGSNAGGEIQVGLEAVRYHVEGGVPVADTAPVQAPTIGVWVDRLDATGSIYYFSASDSGIKRIDLDRRGAEDFLLPLNVGAGCVSCHVLSPDSTQMGINYRSDNTGYVGVWDITGGAQDTQAVLQGEPGDLLTFSPDGEWLLANDMGSLTLYSTADWSSYEVPLERMVAQPEWSPDGDRIVVALPANESFTDDVVFRWASIAYLRVVGPGEIDPEPVVIVESDGVNNNYFPTFSPDGEWVAFTRAQDETSYFASTADIWLVDKDGAQAPVALGAANQGAGLKNSWPRWAPLSDSDFLWLTFSSIRPYGYFNVGRSTPQIWVTAIDEQAARAGEDPSAPAFWLVDQSLDSHNHIPVWGQ